MLAAFFMVTDNFLMCQRLIAYSSKFNMASRSAIVVCLLILCTGLRAQQRYTISGFIKERGSGELLAGTSVAIPKHKTGTTTNVYGFFSLTTTSDTFDLIISYVGFKTKVYRVDLRENTELAIEMEPVTTLTEVVVSADKYRKISTENRMSVIEIPIEQIKDIPALLGEKDVLKVVQLLPGVQKGSEGNSGLYVRGGGPDQNLIILDDATVYNAFHLFGFFSLFNGDALKSVELTKGGFPARYGGRLSSVLDMSMKEGSKEKIHGEAGIGLLSSRLTLEGPIVKGKSSFLISGRRTYADLFYRPFLPSGTDAGYYFYDLNAKANYELSAHNKLFLSGYFGRDKFFFSQGSSDDKFSAGITWGNATGTLRWNHVYNSKLFSNTSLIFSDYNFTNYIEAGFSGKTFSLQYQSGIRDFVLKHDFDFRPSPNHTVRAGLVVNYHTFTPSAIVTQDDLSGQSTNNVQRIHAFENAIYIEDDIKIGPKLKINPGIRLTQFTPKGRQYFNPEPRLSATYMLKPDLSVKASYAEMNQYIHLLSNTGVGLPTDLWVPSTDYVKPQHSRQVAAGVAKDFEAQNFSLSVEGYYKTSNNIIAYKEGASFLDVDAGSNEDNAGRLNWENNVLPGKGWSYGAEFFLQRRQGRFTGWIGYTLSWTQLQFDGLNNGKKFYARYDRRHDISVVGMYKLRKEEKGRRGITLSLTWVYGTGNAITLPIAEYAAPVDNPGRANNLQGGNGTPYVSQYTGRNAFRMAPYHRMDAGIQFHKKHERFITTWEVSVYNLYNRANPYFYYIGNEDDGFFAGAGQKRVLKQVSLFPVIPSVSWGIKF